MTNPVAAADAFLGAGNQYSADAFEGDAGLSRDTYSAAGYFDTPAGLPGYSLNEGVAGATATPFEIPTTGGTTDSDGFSAGIPPAATSSMSAANTALSGDLMNAANGLGGGAMAPAPPPEAQAIPPTGGGLSIPSSGGVAQQGVPGQQQIPGPLPFAPSGQPEQMQIPPAGFTAGGFDGGHPLAADVPFTDNALLPAMAGGGGGGGQAALASDTTSSLSATAVPSVPAAGLSPASPPPGGGSIAEGYQTSGIGAGYLQTNNPMEAGYIGNQQNQGNMGFTTTWSFLGLFGGGSVRSLPGGYSSGGQSRWMFGGGGGDFSGSQYQPNSFESQPMWSSSLGGIGDVAAGQASGFSSNDMSAADQGSWGNTLDQAIGGALSKWGSGGQMTGDPSNPAAGLDGLGATFSNEQMTALGLDNPNAGFEGLGHDPVNNTGGVDPNHPSEDMWSSPLGGMGSASSSGSDNPGFM